MGDGGFFSTVSWSSESTFGFGCASGSIQEASFLTAPSLDAPETGFCATSHKSMNMSQDRQACLEEIHSILSKRTGSKAEERLLNLLRPLTDEGLSEVLNQVNQHRLVKALDDRRWGPKSRKEFLRLLPRAGSLSVSAKGELIRALASVQSELRSEQAIRELFCSESGTGLTELKLAIDCATDGNDLLHILSHFISSADIRFDIINHFNKALDSDEKSLRVVSDIDDTLYSSLHDSRHPKGTVYPGALKLLGEVSQAPPVFLTARPEFIASIFERITHSQLQHYGIKRCTVLSGRVGGLFGHQRMAHQKARTLTSYVELYPEFRFIFLGDSGQGDLAMAESLLDKKAQVIERAFIHRLAKGQPGSESDNAKVSHYSDYPHLATVLCELGYLDREQVESIEQSVTHPDLHSA